MNTPPGRLAPIFGSQGPSSTLEFLVHAGLPELRREAVRRGWLTKGFSSLTVTWLEVKWTADGWKSLHTVSSDDVPCPIVNGVIHLSGAAPGTPVEFAIRVGLACHAPEDTAGVREVGEVWLNNRGRNYTQTTK